MEPSVTVTKARVISSSHEMQRVSEELRLSGKRIGVVPTMGYLHEGHLSLIRIAKDHSDVVITSIFVNPTQFASHEDFEKYPRDFDRDRRLAEEAGTDILFCPDTKNMYPEPYLTYVEVKNITEVLEGKSRPIYFLGVTTIVTKLFHITKPHVAVFGQKDAQQEVVIKQMTRDMNFDVDIVVAPIVREPDGLAMSSRNVYLSPEERKDAVILYESLQLAERMIRNGERNAKAVISAMKKLIERKKSATVDYISIADRERLTQLGAFESNQSVLISLAVRIGNTRLIDNTSLTI
ncbi:MAG: pantoate--beta-alanine ligase [Bacteroidota bacterium]